MVQKFTSNVWDQHPVDSQAPHSRKVPHDDDATLAVPNACSVVFNPLHVREDEGDIVSHAVNFQSRDAAAVESPHRACMALQKSSCVHTLSSNGVSYDTRESRP